MGPAGTECDIHIDGGGAPPNPAMLSKDPSASCGPRSTSGRHALDAYAITTAMCVPGSLASVVLGAFPPSVAVVPFRTGSIHELNSGRCSPLLRQG
jgi:hypothetical protein